MCPQSIIGVADHSYGLDQKSSFYMETTGHCKEKVKAVGSIRGNTIYLMLPNVNTRGL